MDGVVWMRKRVELNAAQAAGAGGAEGGADASANKPAADDNVVDAEVKEVKKG